MIDRSSDAVVSTSRGRPSAPSNGTAVATMGNVPELSVADLSGALKRSIEDQFGHVRVRGEISNYRGPHSSGHAYFCLKDDAARIDAVVWKTSLLRLKTRPQEGLEVVASGRVTTFPGKSTYQIIIDGLEPAGTGALMALLEQRRTMLAAEGLFDRGRKRALPFLPQTIGVVTSPTGAVIRDILHRLEDRFPRAVLLWPVRVQGETAAAEIAAAIIGMNALSLDGPTLRPDVLLVARGGGSLEDLWAFNEENVVRAAAASIIPIVSAVGHETDWTLLDHVADLRAPTPSGAAEMAVPVRKDLVGAIFELAKRRDGAAHRLLDGRQGQLRSLTRLLPGADEVLANPNQRLDRARARLAGAAGLIGDRRHLALSRLAARLSRQEPRSRLAERARDLSLFSSRLSHARERAVERQRTQSDGLGQRLRRAVVGLQREQAHHVSRIEALAARSSTSVHAIVERRTERLSRSAQLLGSLGYRNVLARGYALVRDGSGSPLRTSAVAMTHTVLDIEFADGHIGVANVGAMPPSKRPRPASKPSGQGKLF